VLRRSIEAWRDAEFYGNVRAMVRMLYEVEGPPSLGFIVTTMSEAPAETQLSVLTEVLAKLPADDAVPAARNLAEMTQVPEVRERAEQIAGRG